VADVTLTDLEKELFKKAREGNLNAFSEPLLRLPFSGTLYTPEDRVDVYQVLYEVWKQAGKPDEEFEVWIGGKSTSYKVLWGDYGSEPAFLYPHGYRFLPWGLEMVTCGRPIVIAEGGTGSAKTSTVGIAMLIKCAVHAGFDALNVAPRSTQAEDMMTEVEKWIVGSPFERFIVPTRAGELWKHAPYPLMTIDCGLGTYSTFGCMTLGTQSRLGDVVLGKGKDWINIDEASLVMDIGEGIPKLITRFRGTRRNGVPRSSVPALSAITNPHDGNMGFETLKARAIQEMDDPDGQYYFVRPRTADNVYITQKQIQTQKAVLNEAEQERWMEGKDDQFKVMGTIPIVLIEECYAEYLDELVEEEEERGGIVEWRGDTMGVIHYELPPQENREYVVIGDPGTANMTGIRLNNVPVTGVLDITDFPGAPAVLWAVWMMDGGGKYKPWINAMKYLMDKYMAVFGAFDATGQGTAFSEWPSLEGYNLFPVSLGGGNKGTARTMFKLLCGRGLFAWPGKDYLKVLWHQANVYRESGVNAKNLPDDLIATLFVGTFYLRYEFHDALEVLFGRRDPDEEDVIEAINRSRYQRRGGRYAR
jgi:hypothetical protein